MNLLLLSKFDPSGHPTIPHYSEVLVENELSGSMGRSHKLFCLPANKIYFSFALPETNILSKGMFYDQRDGVAMGPPLLWSLQTSYGTS